MVALVPVVFRFPGALVRNARRVAVLGSFNGWDPTAHLLTKAADGDWMIAIYLPPGRHQSGHRAAAVHQREDRANAPGAHHGKAQPARPHDARPVRDPKGLDRAVTLGAAAEDSDEPEADALSSEDMPPGGQKCAP